MSEGWFDSNGPMGDVGAFMPSELRVDRADLAGHIRQLDGARNLIAVAGGPVAGRHSLVADLLAELNARAPGSAAVLDIEAVRLPQTRDDAPEAFDIAAFVDLLRSLKAATHDTPAPTGASAEEYTAQPRFVLIEGTHLLSNRPLWRDLFPLFDLTVRLTDRKAEPTESRAADLVVIGA